MDNAELEAEGRRLVALAGEGGLALRLLGGIAIRATCPSSARSPFQRPCGDLDFAARGSAAAIEALFAGAGWRPEAEFNLYNGGERLIFHRGDMKADLFRGDFHMCHRIALKGRLEADPLALPLAELLLTKLQIVEANGKDLADAACLLLDHAPGSGDGESINRAAFLGPCAADWGLWRTVTGSLAKLQAWSELKLPDENQRALVSTRIAELLALLGSGAKTLAWKARSVLGEALRWYELPEEVER